MSRAIHKMANGTQYVYESKSYWDKEKKAPRTKQTYIGKLDPATGKLIRKRIQPDDGEVFKPDVRTIGPTLLLGNAAESTGLSATLRRIFPGQWENILSLAYYICHSGNALSHCESWARDHKIPGLLEFSSQNISRLLGTINPDDRQKFLAAWSGRFSEKEMLCYDITSISSYSKAMDFVRYGYNRDHESLPQINLAMLYGQTSRLPVYYRHLPGSISDVSTLKKTISLLDYTGVARLCLVMDMGFYSQSNIDALYRHGYKFLMGAPNNRKWIEDIIDEQWNDLNSAEHFQTIGSTNLYAATYLRNWNGHRSYVHVFYNENRKAQANDEFMSELLNYRSRRAEGLPEKDRIDFYERFLQVKETPKRGILIGYDEAAVTQYRARHTGVFVLISNFEKDTAAALECYRNKDVVEKSFDDLKAEADCKRLRMHSDKVAENKLFLCFLALILRSHLTNCIRECSELVQLGIPRILQEMNTLREVKVEHRYRSVITEPTRIQQLVMDTLNIKLPQA